MTDFHRENKNRPRAISSKRPVPVFREVFQVKKQHHRDPRFDDLSGTFDEESFEEDYSFIKDIKKREKQELLKELKFVGDNFKRKEEILYLLQRMKNQEHAKKALEKRKAEENKRREDVMEAAKSGIKPYYPKKSVIKKQELIEDFKALKNSGKLEKYLEKKRKKNFAKDTKRFYN
ncbi:hypothetical protein JTE90_019163 [Oedothorax gibbosus]|uniref:rRNA biogenesis protein RRP36 n=1 Tax=Oedothorax gibbosus TaxID=931172 RepID=A0AAV6USU0_9ARAC|nr:hypothetical protein JTE90_019163 [Oedothorax gibbosus]